MLALSYDIRHPGWFLRLPLFYIAHNLFVHFNLFTLIFPPLRLFNLIFIFYFILDFPFHAVILLCSDFSLNLPHFFLPLELV